MQTLDLVEEFIQHCHYLCLSPATIRVYTWGLRRLVSQCPALPCGGTELMWVLGDPQLANESRRDLRRILGRFFGWASRIHHLPNPLEDIEPIRRRKLLPRVLTEIEIERLFDAACSRRDRALLAIPLDNGLRVGEIANLTWADIGPDYIVAEGKTGRRVVPLGEEVRRSLIGLGDGHHIWLGRKGPLTVEGVKQIYRRLFQEAGIRGRKTGCHTLRHTFATLYLKHGGNIRMLQEIMGHQDLRTTTLYLHLAGVDVAVDHAKFSPIRTLGFAGRLAG